MPDLHRDPKALRAASERLRTMVPTEHDLRQGAALLTAIADQIEGPAHGVIRTPGRRTYQIACGDTRDDPKVATKTADIACEKCLAHGAFGSDLADSPPPAAGEELGQ